jgi:hypothetical protein
MIIHKQLEDMMHKNITRMIIGIIISIACFTYGNAQENNQPPQPLTPQEPSSPPMYQDDFPLFPEEYEPVDEYESSLTAQEEQKKALTAIFETRLGIRTQSAIQQDEFSIAEARLQAKYKYQVDSLTLNCQADLVLDPILDRYDVKIKEGTGFIDLRDLNLTFIPSDYMDLIIGRQTMKWGTGDLLYINNLFPKDWSALYIGRDESYHNAPTDAIKLGFYSLYINMDLIYVPMFDSDRVPTGERFSYYNPIIARRVGEDYVLDIHRRNDLFKEDEWASRIYNTINDFEFALYFYNGYWKSPGGFEPLTMRGTYPRLNVYGLSVQGPVVNGIACFEMGLYESKDDKAGNNPLVKNSQLRMLFGYRFDLPNQMQLSTQYYIEIMRDHQNYQKALAFAFPNEPPTDEGRHVITARLTQQIEEPNLNMSILAYYCPTDTDMYLRPAIQYLFNDFITILGGANLFVGNEDHTHWGQYERDSNIYAGMQYRF